MPNTNYYGQNPGEPPWWKTMGSDPWYMTGAKALLGEREVEAMRRGDAATWINTMSPLLFMGRPGMMRGAQPRVTGSILKGGIEKVTDFGWPFWWGDPKKFPPVASGDPFSPPVVLPPAKPSRYWNATPFNWENLPTGSRFRQPEAPPPGPVEEVGPVDWNWYTPKQMSPKQPMFSPYSTKSPSEQIKDLMAGGKLPPMPPARLGDRIFFDVGKWMDYKPDFPGIPKDPGAIGPFAPRPEPPIKITKEDLPFGQEKIKITPEEVKSQAQIEAEAQAKGEANAANDPVFKEWFAKTYPGQELPSSVSYGTFKNWQQMKLDQANTVTPKGVLPPKDESPAAELERILYWGGYKPGGKPYYPYSSQEMETISGLGLPPPPRTSGEIQQDWLHYLQKHVAPGGDEHQQPGGLMFKPEHPGYYPYDFPYDPGVPYNPPARTLPVSPNPTPPPPMDFSQFGYVYPQMRIFPQPDWYRSMRGSQMYPNQLTAYIA